MRRLTISILYKQISTSANEKMLESGVGTSGIPSLRKWYLYQNLMPGNSNSDQSNGQNDMTEWINKLRQIKWDKTWQ